MLSNDSCRTFLRWCYSSSQLVQMLRLDGTVVALSSEKWKG